MAEGVRENRGEERTDGTTAVSLKDSPTDSPSGKETPEPWRQEIRLAMTMVGGASLAVWMGGIASETSQVLHASRDEKTESVYRRLIDLLHVTVSIDVLTGTSAGGINAACLGLAEAFGSTPEVLRDTWIGTGSLDNLIRDPNEKLPRSLLDGDRVLLGDLERALHSITSGGTPPAEEPDITVLLTGTMIDGETARFDDALGNLVRDTDHRMLFRFDGPLWTPDVLGPLALAARSSASFPGAFELSRMPIGKDGTDRLHPDMTRYTELTRSHWLTDGGVLLNKPLRPALREIFERPSHADVRRLLLYVVPTGEREADVVEVDAGNPPLLGTALSKVVSTVLNQTISTDLEDLTRHNDAVVRTRDTRVSLSAMGLRGDPDTFVDARLMAAYRERRVAEDASELVRAASRVYVVSEVDGLKAQWASGMSAQLRTVAADGLRDGVPDQPPGGRVSLDELIGFRTTALDDAVGTGIQVINAGFRLGPSPEQAAQLNECRALLHQARRAAARGVKLTPWVVEHEPPPAGMSLDGWIAALAAEWAGKGRADTLREAWPSVAGALRQAAPVLRALVGEQTEGAADTVRTLLDWFGLTADDKSAGDDVVLARLLALHVATRGLLAQPPSVDQRVDLVQVSADTRTLLDMSRTRAHTKLTGMQVGDFGAFYKASWRASDWMWGRIDGAGWLMQCLLDPKRLRLLRDLAGAGAFRERVRETFKSVGWILPGPADNLGPGEAESFAGQLAEELGFLGLDAQLRDVEVAEAVPLSMPVTAMVLARARQLEIAREELPVVCRHAEEDLETAKGNGKASAAFRKVGAEPTADDAATQRVFQTCRVSAEKVEDERGTMLLTSTLIKAGAAGMNAAAGAARVPKSVQPAVGFAQTTGRSAWWITRGAVRLGRPWNLVAAAVTVLAGFVLGGNGGQVLQWVGMPVAAGALVFLVVSLITLRRTWRMVLTVLGVLVVAALLFAAFLPPIADPLFGWLGGVVAGWRRGEAPVWWLVVAALIVLPAVWTPLGSVTRRLRRPAPKDRP
ncbi:patatin-like protein [Amycolatopsis sp. NPDC058986]|uniref:patatin-like protein n=1 Tax=unclassified Amycolatopsis TaxID=2618356 RepID=UPI0036719D0B